MIWDCLKELKRSGLSILIIDKNIQALARICDRHYVMEKGRCVWQGDSRELTSDPGIGELLGL